MTFSRDDGRVQTYRIVGEDEADPKTGSISFVSPVAKMLIGKTVGDIVEAAGQELEITAISYDVRRRLPLALEKCVYVWRQAAQDITRDQNAAPELPNTPIAAKCALGGLR